MCVKTSGFTLCLWCVKTWQTCANICQLLLTTNSKSKSLVAIDYSHRAYTFAPFYRTQSSSYWATCGRTEHAATPIEASMDKHGWYNTQCNADNAGVFLQLFPLLARDSTLSLHNKLALYKLLIRPILTYAAPIWSNTSLSNYRHLQILQSKCLRVIGDYPRHTPISHLNSTLLLEPIHKFIYRLTKIFFTTVPHTPTRLFAK